ncbi:PhnA domain-containing protein [Bermanella sp. R86510]|uniref:PhnA domain-containing protein n=1 Tax=unclassified Bermanella TaxID=2627862 RepID=UPI0037C6E0C1
MSLEQLVNERSGGKCELCGSEQGLTVQAVEPSDGTLDSSIHLCATCSNQLGDADNMDVNHWRCLNDSMWNPEPAVQVVAYRQLHQMVTKGETWAQDSLDMMYLEPETEKWAKLGMPDPDAEPTLDANGAPLQAGDSVTLVKDLVVKGANFTAKQGTMVRGIRLTSNPKHIEGKVNGSMIVIIAEYCKKA